MAERSEQGKESTNMDGVRKKFSMGEARMDGKAGGQARQGQATKTRRAENQFDS